MKLLIDKKLSHLLEQAYGKGLYKGYELGWKMKETELNNKGFIIGNKMQRDIEEILKEAKWKTNTKGEPV